jgi:hypothetical protein
MDLEYSESDALGSSEKISPILNGHQMDDKRKTLKHSNSVFKRESSHRYNCIFMIIYIMN